MEEMFFSGTPLLEPVGLREPFVVELRKTIRDAIFKAMIPMRAYCAQYQSFLEVLNLDPVAYIRSVWSLSLICLNSSLVN